MVQHRSLASLIRICLPRSLMEIQERAFEGCVSLKTVELGLSNDEKVHFDSSSLKVIGRGSFIGCISLISVEFPSSVQKIEEQAFESCTSLQEATLPKALLRIGSRAFFKCINLRLLELNDGLRYIGKGAFCSCRAIECVRLPPTIKNIDEFAFGDCKKLLSVEFPETAQCCLLRSNVFAGCEKLLNCYLPLKQPQRIAFAENDLMFRFGGPDYNNLQRRFDHLPIHKLCYIQWTHSTHIIRQQLEVLMEDNDVYESGYRADCFFLNPFHILSLSHKLNTEIFHFLFKRYPGVDLNEHNILGMSPMGILLERVRMGSLNVEALQLIVGMVLHDRLHALRPDEAWVSEFQTTVKSIGGCDPKKDVSRLLQKLEFRENKESLTILELAMWKAKLIKVTNTNSLNKNTGNNKRKRKFCDAFPDDAEHCAVRSSCRSQSGSEFVVPLVLGYLRKPMEDSERGIVGNHQ
ncbi:unnamed protein product [Cylindrotheca closterium]|uniref:Uncharacterized protein n=1 Tax=Cylindrotheca closterium TaxID=2856 RepID=A0AAD2PWP6_9STRA|nr:unnamed protein product [Cylindrotheca closterium]